MQHWFRTCVPSRAWRRSDALSGRFNCCESCFSFFCKPRSQSQSSSGGGGGGSAGGGSSSSLPPALTTLARSWSEVAQGYEELLVPRFAPWAKTVLAELDKRSAGLPQGPVVVPCCGTGQELLTISAIVGQRQIIGIDLAPGMVAKAWEHAYKIGPHVSVRCQDATSIKESQCAGIVSIFGLQQFPAPATALLNWCEALAPGGIALVCFWLPGPACEDLPGPWAVYSRLFSKALGKSEQPQAAWPSELAPAALDVGMTILVDRVVQHEISWDSAETCWEAMTRAGPWHAARLSRGEGFVEKLKPSFLAAFDADCQIVHAPSARLLVLQRLAS